MVKINLLFSGASVRGAYFTGFTYTLFTKFKDHFEINNIYGTSAGALTGFLLASGNVENLRLVFDIRQKSDIAKHWIGIPYLNMLCLPYMAYYKKGLMNPEPIHNIFRNIKIEPINYLNKLNVTAFNMSTHKTEYFNCANENYHDYLFASMAIPCIFPPYRIKGIDYSDGSFSEFLPISQIYDNRNNNDNDIINLLLSARYNNKITDPQNIAECIQSYIVSNCKSFYDINMIKTRNINNMYIYEIDKKFEKLEIFDVSLDLAQSMWLNGKRDAYRFIKQLKTDGKI
jgi:predicted acylesterase/phospholipase RssA